MTTQLLTYLLPLAVNGSGLLSTLLVVGVVGAFVATLIFNAISLLRIRNSDAESRKLSTVMQRTLDTYHNYVLRLDLRERHAYNLHGDMLPAEGLGYEESFKLIHPDDRDTYRRFATRLYRGEVDNDECVFRWDISGEKHLGEWRYFHDLGVAEYGNGRNHHATNIFCTLTDQTAMIEQELEEVSLTDKYRKSFEQSIVGLAFYSSEGYLLNANQKMREILKFQGDEDPFYFGNTLFEMPTFRDVLNNHRIEELYFCAKSVVVERGVNCYTELRVHPIYDDDGKLVYITLSIRDVTQERELYLQNKRNDEEIRQANNAIQQFEEELQYVMDNCDMRFFRTSFVTRVITFYKNMSTPEVTMDFEELIAHFVDSPFAEGLRHPESYFHVPKSTLTHMHPFFHEGDELQWNFIDSVPSFDADGRLVGSYGIVRNVTALIEKQERLKEETRRANDSGRQKSVFMANMTHEIRTPLNAIVGFSDLLSMVESPEEKQEMIHVIMNNCDMLLRLVNDILLLSNADENTMRLIPSDVDMAYSFNEICQTLRQRVEGSTQAGVGPADVKFIAVNPYEVCRTETDNSRIQQVITNFVTNAVKYTQKGHIRVGYVVTGRKAPADSGTAAAPMTMPDVPELSGDGLLFYCEDTGTGIPKDQSERIFERFIKLNDFIQGTGLGLSICKVIVEKFGGKIGVESEEGQGSTFWFWIPADIKEIKETQITP